MELSSYYDFAEQDYQYFMEDINNGRVANYLGAMAQNICERYLKHIIDRKYEPTNEYEEAEKTSHLRTHSLSRLIKFVEKNIGKIPDEAKTECKIIDGFYFSTRYPGEDSITLDKDDMMHCKMAVCMCREYTATTMLNRSLTAEMSKAKNAATHKASHTDNDSNPYDSDGR